MSDVFDDALLQPQTWEPFHVKGQGELLSRARLSGGTELLVYTIHAQKYALLTSQMTYYHVAQGSLHGTPFVVSFCCVCHSGAQLDPRVEGSVLQFQCGGLYHGTAILRDLETGSLWHHMTGIAMHGSKAGSALAASPLQVTTVAAALQDDPEMRLHRASRHTVTARALQVGARVFQLTGFLPPVFTKTLPEEDSRLPRMALGLGIRVGGEARFYEMSRLRGEPVRDTVAGKQLEISVGKIDKVPFAVDESGKRPMQYFLRWYGFALTYPHCTVWAPA